MTEKLLTGRQASSLIEEKMTNVQSIFFQMIGLVRNTHRVSNSLDPDQAQHFVGPDLGSNFLSVSSS